MARPMPLVSPCAPWLCRGTSTPTGLARAATTRLVALRATTSMASSITPTGSTIYSSPPPWEGENYEPRNPMESATFNEPWISVAQKQGFRIIVESHSTRSEAAGDELDGPTLAAMFRAEAAAAARIDKDPWRHARYLIEEAGGLLDKKDLKVSRLLNAPPEPYTRERFDHTYQWTLGWGLVEPGATFESTVDNRAWQ